MKKSIIAAGAASVTLAAMPVLGAFATGTIYGSPIKDTLTITSSEVCTMSRNATAHPVGATAPTGAAWTADTAQGAGANDQVFTATIVAGQSYADIAESTFDITCNSADEGYKVTVAVTDFDSTNFKYGNSGDAGLSSSYWNLTSSAKSGTAITNNAQVWSAAAETAVTSDSFTITYNVYTDISLAATDYTATATYTLANI
ncbi:hypothetical protein IJI79_02975 [Candidatus Saccharibacteria bacterium]|nr:hypothetical protein [Candidatus Saccharibacteria bacterium]